MAEPTECDLTLANIATITIDPRRAHVDCHVHLHGHRWPANGSLAGS